VLFFGVTLGSTSRIDTGLNGFEKKVLGQLQTLVQKSSQASSLLPRLPTILPKVIQALRDEESSAPQIAELIEQDHILVAEVMRLVHSPYYKTRQEITSLKQATVMLGREGLRQLVASAIVRPMLNTHGGHFVKLSSRLLWDHAEKTALGSSLLCKADEELRFYAYLAGLLQNMGFTVGFAVLDNIFDGTEAPNSKQFLFEFIMLCRKLSVAIVRSWSLPEMLCEAVRMQSLSDSDNNASSLANTLYIADHIAKAQILSQRLSLDPAKTSILLNRKPCEDCIKCLEAIDHRSKPGEQAG
jgi:HD-like signal output (HDOD) protein